MVARRAQEAARKADAAGPVSVWFEQVDVSPGRRGPPGSRNA
jgi:hypothetical protein